MIGVKISEPNTHLGIKTFLVHIQTKVDFANLFGQILYTSGYRHSRIWKIVEKMATYQLL